MPKVIAIDNFGREHISDKLTANNLSWKKARKLAKILNDNASGGDNSPWYYRAVDDNYKLYKYNIIL